MDKILTSGKSILTMLQPEPKVGEIWYCKIKEASCLSTFEVTDLTCNTIEVTNPSGHGGHLRYERHDLRLVERKNK